MLTSLNGIDTNMFIISSHFPHSLILLPSSSSHQQLHTDDKKKVLSSLTARIYIGGILFVLDSLLRALSYEIDRQFLVVSNFHLKFF